MVGGFSGHVGLFFADDVLDGRAIKVRFIWPALPGKHPTWETNWTMEFVPAC